MALDLRSHVLSQIWLGRRPTPAGWTERERAEACRLLQCLEAAVDPDDLRALQMFDVRVADVDPDSAVVTIGSRHQLVVSFKPDGESMHVVVDCGTGTWEGPE